MDCTTKTAKRMFQGAQDFIETPTRVDFPGAVPSFELREERRKGLSRRTWAIRHRHG
jgi:hypothetical protein